MYRRFLSLLAVVSAISGCGQAPSLSTSRVAGASVSPLGKALDSPPDSGSLRPLDGRVCRHPWVFSDLGAGTLVDTSRYDFDRDIGEIAPAPGAVSYLEDLEAGGYTIGLIVNVPAEWGKNADTKIFRVIDMIDRAWTSPVLMNWSLFGKTSGMGAKRHFEGRFLVPDTDAHRKPHPFLFKEAMSLARGCDALYTSTLFEEAPGAEAAGMAAHIIVNHKYLPVSQIDQYVARHKPK